METWLIKGIWGTGLWKLLQEFEVCVKLRHVDAHQKKCFLGLEGDQNEQSGVPVCSLEVVTWVHEMSGYGGTAAMQRWAESRHICLVPSEAQSVSKH